MTREEQEPKYCDRNICIKNEYNGIGCEDCEVTKSQVPVRDDMTDKEFINSVDKMTTEKLFEELENIGCDGYYRDIWSAIVGELKHRIEKVEQEPKTVIYSGDGYADGYMVYDMAECPNCGYEYEEGDKDWKEPFCPHCGQPLEWESEVEQ